MPNSEQEMRERVEKFLDSYKPAPANILNNPAFEVGRLADFATLERAEARRETLLEAMQTCEDEKVDFEATGEDGDEAYNAACDHIKDALRAKLTPAPEECCPTCGWHVRNQCVGFCPDKWHGDGVISNGYMAAPEAEKGKKV